MMGKILIIGCGNIGGELAVKLAESGHSVTSLSRTLHTNLSNINFIQADVTNAKDIEVLTLDFDQIVYILSPSVSSINAYKAVFETGVDNVLNTLNKKQPSAALIFVSSSRVYGQQTGEWLSEESRTDPTDERGKILLAAEKKFLSFNSKATIVRFSGIYGRSNYLINQIKKGLKIQKSPLYYTNRIHRDDCIGVLEFLLNKKNQNECLERIYIASDNQPAAKWEVASYLVSQLKLKPCKALVSEKAMSQNKRLDNRRLLEAGYEFKFKTYKDGYGDMISGEV